MHLLRIIPSVLEYSAHICLCLRRKNEHKRFKCSSYCLKKVWSTSIELGLQTLPYHQEFASESLVAPKCVRPSNVCFQAQHSHSTIMFEFKISNCILALESWMLSLLVFLELLASCPVPKKQKVCLLAHPREGMGLQALMWWMLLTSLIYIQDKRQSLFKHIVSIIQVSILTPGGPLLA